MRRTKQALSLGVIVAAVAAYRRLRATWAEETDEPPTEELTGDRPFET